MSNPLFKFRRWSFPCAVFVCGCSVVLDANSLAGGLDASIEDASADGGTDATPVDGSNGGDTNNASDASDGAPAGGPFCSSLSPQPGFCVDFDSPPYNTSDWDKAFPISSSVALSLPNAARFSIAGAGASVLSTGKFSTNVPSTMRVRFAARRDRATSVQLLYMGFDKSTQYFVTFDGEVTMRTKVGSTGSTYSTGLPTPTDAWVAVDLLIDCKSRTFGLKANGKSSNTIPMDNAAGCNWAFTEIGIQYAGGAVTVDIDNLAVDIQ